VSTDEKADTVTVVLPEYVPESWWQHLLDGQSAQFLKLSPVHAGVRGDQRAGASDRGRRRAALGMTCVRGTTYPPGGKERTT
jgi:hypothetical protein